MKLIATVTIDSWNPAFLVEVTKEELRTLTGDQNVVPQIGKIYDVHAAWQMVRRHRDSQADLARAAQTLRALADLCEQQSPLLIGGDVSSP